MTIIAFTSCAKVQDVPKQKVWDKIAAREPDALLLLGDNIYLKRDDHTDAAELAADLEQRYRRQFKQRHFAALLEALRARGAALCATWDDHDAFGDERGGGDLPPTLVAAARAVFHRWLPVSTNPPEIYCRRDVGDATLLTLDGRSYRTVKRARTDRNGMLGAAQWKWLEAELATPRKRYTLVCSGSPLYDYDSTGGWLEWPAARRRLVALLRNRPGTLFVAGDVHDNELGDSDGVIEVVSSAVARLGKVKGWTLGNYGVLDLQPDGVRVRLRGRQRKQKHDVFIPLADWRLPTGSSTARR